MTKEEFIKELNSYFPIRKLAAVKLVKDASKLWLKESKDLVDKYWYEGVNCGSSIANELESKYDIYLNDETEKDKKLKIFSKFSKLYHEADGEGLRNYFNYLCEIHIDTSYTCGDDRGIKPESGVVRTEILR